MFSEASGTAGAFGRELLEYIGILFDYWHQFKADQLSRERLCALMEPVRGHA